MAHVPLPRTDSDSETPVWETVRKRRKLNDTPPKTNSNFKVTITGILPAVSNNPIMLAKLIKGEKPNSKIRNMNILKNKDIEIFVDSKDQADYLNQQWKQNTQLGNPPNPKQTVLPQKNSILYPVVACGINPAVEENEIKIELIDQGYNPIFIKRLISKQTTNPTWKIKIA